MLHERPNRKNTRKISKRTRKRIKCKVERITRGRRMKLYWRVKIDGKWTYKAANAVKSESGNYLTVYIGDKNEL